MFRKKSVIGILIITIVLMFIAGCSEVMTPGLPSENEKKPSAQGIAHQQATVHLPDQAQAVLPFGPVLWSNEIEIRHYNDGNTPFEYYVIELGEIVQPETSPILPTGIYVSNKTSNTVFFSRYVDDIPYGPIPNQIDPLSEVRFDYSDYSVPSLVGYTLVSVERSANNENVWEIRFEAPQTQPGWASEIRIYDLGRGVDMQIGDIVQGILYIYNIANYDLVCKQISLSGESQWPLFQGSDYYGITYLGGLKLDSVTPIVGFDHGWEMLFVTP